MNATTDVEVSSNPNEYESQLIIPAGTQATGNTTDPYSITCYAPAPRVINLFPKKNNGSKTRGDGDDDYDYEYDDDDDSPIVDGDEIGDITAELLNIYCTPHGAQFDKPVGIKVNVGSDFAGEILILEDENGEEQEAVVQPDGYVQFKVNHFSLKRVKQKIKSLKTDHKRHAVRLVYENNVMIEPGGKYTVNYQMHEGMQQVLPEKELNGVTRILRSCQEGHKLVDMTKKISSKSGCYADIKIYQEYYKYTVRYEYEVPGGYRALSVTFRRWEGLKYFITKRPLDSGHSGGSGK